MRRPRPANDADYVLSCFTCMLLHIFLYAFLNKVWECFCILRVQLFFECSGKSCCPSLFWDEVGRQWAS